MSSVPQDNRFAPPEAHVEDVSAGDGALELAGRGARLGAVLIDMVIMLLALWLLSRIVPWSIFNVRPTPGERASSAVTGFVAFLVIQGYFLATRGQTVGKMLLDIKIVRSSGERAAAGRLIGLRYGVGSLVSLVPFLGPVYGTVDALLIFRGSRQCLHDNIADTIVVKA